MEVHFLDKLSRSDVVLTLSDGRIVPLQQGTTTTGKLYENQDKSFQFLLNAGTARIQETGVTTYDKCFASI